MDAHRLTLAGRHEFVAAALVNQNRQVEVDRVAVEGPRVGHEVPGKLSHGVIAVVKHRQTAGELPGCHPGGSEFFFETGHEIEGRRQQHEPVHGASAPRASRLTAACSATNAPRLDPTSAIGPSPCASMAAFAWSIMRDTVSAVKSGSLRSGHV